MSQIKKVSLTGNGLTIQQVKTVARDYATVDASKSTLDKCRKGRKVLEYHISKKKKIYGVTTGFGNLSTHFIEADQAAQLQVNLIRSHNAGVGQPVPEEVVRATMLTRANYIASGMSGARCIILQTLIQMLNKRIIPFVPQQGSVGSSGDLAPLAAIACVIMGEGEAFYKGERMPGAEAMKKASIPKVKILSKEGLALINGDSLMVGYAALAVYDAISLAKMSDLAIAMTLEGIIGNKEPFKQELQRSRGFKGQIESARNVRKLIEGSEILDRSQLRVQDSYVLRCAPVIMGASRDAIDFVQKQVETELNGSIGNPIIYVDDSVEGGGTILAGGNFHGQPVALPLDYLGIAVAELANSSEIRMERLLNPHYNHGLPAFLTPNPGLNSGFMIPQYTAAGLVNENKGLAWPNSVDSIPVCGGQEDHVSMGTNSALSVRRIVNNTQYVLGTELFMCAQALDIREGLLNRKASNISRKIRDFIRTKIPFIEKDCILQKFMEQSYTWIKNEDILAIIEQNGINIA